MQFIVGDIASLTLPQPVDVIVGRLVLMYLPDPTAVLRHLRTLVADGGVRGPDSRIYRQVAEVTRAVLPLMIRTGVASAETVDIDTLETRMRNEATALDATLVAPPLIGAWARNS